MSAFNAYHYIALGCTAVVLFIIIQYFSGALITFVRSLYKRHASGKHAIERLRNLPRGEPLEPPPAASPEIPLPASGEVPPTLEHAEPLEVQPAANAEVPLPVGVEVQPILEHAEPLEVQSAASAEVSLPVCAKVEPSLERAELLEVQPGVSAEVPPPVGAKVEPNPEGSEPLEVQPAVSTEVPLVVRAKVQPILERAKPLKIQPAVRTEVPLPVNAKVRPILERAEPLEVQPAARPELPLQVGSKVWAVCEFGSVPKGTPGIITGIADGRFFWQSPTYLCTFADNRKVRARPKDIEVHNHGHSLQELEHPNLGSILSRRMTLRAQQLLSRQRPTHLPLAGKTKVPNEIAEINTGA
jgi:hypothetical protein